MAKSTRSKVKRSFRAKKREEGVYAAVEAARLQRLSSKLDAVRNQKVDEVVEDDAADVEPTGADDNLVLRSTGDGMHVDGNEDAQSAPTGKISTHGPRGSRRENWRASKGMAARPKSKGMNRQGGIAAVRKAGRSKRRR
ncbi:hypothetical protein BD410DRAFT_779689 [Rickenella mellea]|uniref:DUF2423 domain-containing protein n=1 Tax=Rickenella mellea TaxID=50990 RepID=A0A4R5XGL0_9AGAM|nr:hypothetical protein BD410DRAFT_779689 [Rickenella mellea]